MKRTIGVAALLGLLAAGAFTSTASAQCGALGSGLLISFNNGDVFAYESNYNVATYLSAPGSQLTVVGFVNQFCAPLQDQDPTDPSKEYTFIWNAVSAGTVGPAPFGASGLKWDTDYLSGTFTIYMGSPRNAPTLATLPANPPNATVPVNFTDGTAILTGTFNDPLHVTITKNSTGTFSGSVNGTYQFNGGTLFGRVGTATSNVNGLWCSAGSGSGHCTLPAGYSAHPSGKWDSPSSTPATPSTWGSIQSLYR